MYDPSSQHQHQQVMYHHYPTQQQPQQQQQQRQQQQMPPYDQYAQGVLMPMLAYQPGAVEYTGFIDDARFQTYFPNEVRHRKRTSRAQLQVLETAFVEDQKPGPQVRRKISAQIGMTARAVQVWFQNRRAKEKNLQKKAAQAINSRNQLTQGDAANHPTKAEDDEDEDDEDGDCNELLADAIETPTEGNSRADAIPNLPALPSKEEGVLTPPASSPESVGTSRSTSVSLPRSSPDLAMLRRGSAPAIVSDGQNLPLGPPDAIRRQSLEQSFARMQAQPYPTSMRQVVPPSSFRRSQLAVSTDMSAPRARLSRVPSGSTALPAFDAQAPSSGMLLGRTQSHPSIAGWVNQTAASAAAASSGFPIRAPVPPQLPGPLPAADFSFGAPPAPMDQTFAERSGRMAYAREEDIDSPTAESYQRFGSFASVSEGDPARMSRFGSFASVASDVDPTHGTRFGSFASVDSSASASTYYSSLATPEGWVPDSRRSSCAEFANMLAHMQVNAPAASTTAASTPELFKSSSPPFNGAAQYEGSPSSSDGSGGTVHYSPPPEAKPEHRSELEYALQPMAAPAHQQQRYTPPVVYNNAARRMSVPRATRESSSSLENAMGDSSLGMTSTSSSGSSAASSNSSLPLPTPVDKPRAFASADFHQPIPLQCFPPHVDVGYYAGAPGVRVQPPSADMSLALGIDPAYPFFGA